ncbi:hypothetical protein Tco_0408281 [Tanacetum coccineum]
MAALKFTSSHNMVAFLDKPTGSDGFEQIVDFLNAHPIKYALTVNPTIYTACIEQFWATAKVKTVNGEVHIQALVDKKKVIITEISVRSDLQLEDAEGLYKVFHGIKQVEGMSKHKGIYVTPSHTMKEGVGEGSEILTDPYHTPTITLPSTSQPKKKHPRKSKKKNTKVPQPSDSTDNVADENVPTHSNDPLLSEITKLKERVKKLERRNKSRTPGLKRLRKINTASTSITTASINITTAEPVTTASAPITTAGVSVSTTEPSTPPTITTLIEDEDLTIAQTLMKMRSVKSKEKSKEKGVSSETATRLTRGVIMKEASETASRPIVPPQQQLDPKDKGKCKMAELEEEERLAKQEEEEANITKWDDVHAMMGADYELAARLQAEEQGELTIKERSRLFVELMDKKKRHFAKLRAKEQRRKPPTKTQKMNQMSTYLKNMTRYKHTQMKSKSHDEIQELFDKEMKSVNTFMAMDSDVVEGSGKNTESSGKKSESSRKRTRAILDDESDDSVVNVESLAIKYPIVVWRTYILAEDKIQDVLDLYRLVKERFETTSPEGYDKLLWGDLITLFEPSEEDEIWKTQQDYTLIRWRLNDSCRVHLLLMDTGISIHMLVEKKYPLTQEMLSRMLSRRLEVDHECEMAFELLRFIKSQYKK